MLIFIVAVFPSVANALDIECVFSGERRPTLYRDMVSGENITFSEEIEDVKKKEVYWGDDYITIILESTGIATLIVINRKDFSATKRVTRAGISRGDVRGSCKIYDQEK